MQYTNYFALSVKHNGVPNLDEYQFKRYMNIIHLEGVLKEKVKNMDRKNFLSVFNEGKKLTNLTGNQPPEQLLKEMLQSSKNS